MKFNPEKFIKELPSLPVWGQDGKVSSKQPVAFVRDAFVLVSAEEGDGAAEYYGINGFPFIYSELEKYARKNGGHWEWRDPSAIIFVQ